MQYFGGKVRLASYIAEVINTQYLDGNERAFVDLFCGSCNVMSRIEPNRLRLANDKHYYLIEMFRALSNYWTPPKSISEAEYKHIKDNKDELPWLTGFVGFALSFSGKWFGGYCRSNTNRNYCMNGRNSILKKMSKMKNVSFHNRDYKDCALPLGAVVYCDIPYKNTTQYDKKEVGTFDHDEFYVWIDKNKHKYTFLISEYAHNVPENFEIVWVKESRQDIRNKKGEQTKTIEVLIRPKEGFNI